jgi:hypothetical protein
MGWLVNRVTITFAAIAVVIVLWNLYVVQHDDGILAGTVVGPDGRPVPGAEVVLSERTIVSLEPIAQTVTDDQGHFRFTGHDRHRVVLTARKPEVGASDRLEVRLYFRNQNRELEEPLQLAP